MTRQLKVKEFMGWRAWSQIHNPKTKNAVHTIEANQSAAQRAERHATRIRLVFFNLNWQFRNFICKQHRERGHNAEGEACERKGAQKDK